MRYCGHFLINAEGGAKNYERDHPLPLAWRAEKELVVKNVWSNRLNVQCPPMSLEKVWQAILRQFWRYVRPRVNPKDGFDFNEILWSFLDQSRRWGQELRT